MPTLQDARSTPGRETLPDQQDTSVHPLRLWAVVKSWLGALSAQLDSAAVDDTWPSAEGNRDKNLTFRELLIQLGQSSLRDPVGSPKHRGQQPEMDRRTWARLQGKERQVLNQAPQGAAPG